MTLLSICINQNNLKVLSLHIGHLLGCDRPDTRESKFFRAISINDVTTVKNLVDSGCKINKGILHYASWKNYQKIVQLLIDNGIDLNEQIEDGSTPLHQASQELAYESVRLLLENGADANLKDIHGNIALHKACMQMQNPRHSPDHLIQLFRLVLEKTNNINSKNKDLQSPLHFAMVNDFESGIEMITALYDNGADINTQDCDGFTPCHYAIQRKDLRYVKFFFEHGFDSTLLTHKRLSVLHLALDADDLPTIQYLLQAKINLGLIWYYDSYLHYYIKIRKDVPIGNMEPDEIDYCDDGTDEDFGLEFSYHDIDGEVVAHLVDFGVAIDFVDDRGMTALHYAAKRGHVDAVDVLLSRGASFNIQDNWGMTPLMWALKRSAKPEIIDALLEYEPNQKVCNILRVKFGDCAGAIARYMSTLHYYTKKGLSVLQLASQIHRFKIDSLLECQKVCFLTTRVKGDSLKSFRPLNRAKCLIPNRRIVKCLRVSQLPLIKSPNMEVSSNELNYVSNLFA
eukprot:NODE_1121_length_2108_cov_0.419612.p1 type:complete len:512 gc:universal NODE_1121_length_2108_cov_0.419612:418-1953(+)